MNRILTYFFGNKIKIVTARTLRSFMEFEQEFVFHKNMCDSEISNFLWKSKDYSVQKIKRLRTKTIVSPSENQYRALTKEKCIQMFD